MANHHTRSDLRKTSNTPAEPDRKHESGGNMGAGKSGGKSFGSEKPEDQDNFGSSEPGKLTKETKEK